MSIIIKKSENWFLCSSRNCSEEFILRGLHFFRPFCSVLEVRVGTLRNNYSLFSRKGHDASNVLYE